MNEESSDDLNKKIALLEQQLAAITAERNLLHEQLGRAQEATLAVERRAAATETELKILREQKQVSDGEVTDCSDLAPPQPQSPSSPTTEQPLPPASMTQHQPQPDPQVQPQSPPDIDLKDESVAASSIPPDNENKQDQSRIAKIWRWLWEENDRRDQSA